MDATSLHLPGKPRGLPNFAQQYSLPLSRVSQLVRRYGSRALPILQLIQQQGEQPLQHHAGYSALELHYLIEHEQVQQLEDLLVRRTSLAICGELTPSLVDRNCSTDG